MTRPAAIATISPQTNANTGFFCRSRHAVTLQGASGKPRATVAHLTDKSEFNDNHNITDFNEIVNRIF